MSLLVSLCSFLLSAQGDRRSCIEQSVIIFIYPTTLVMSNDADLFVNEWNFCFHIVKTIVVVYPSLFPLLSAFTRLSVPTCLCVIVWGVCSSPAAKFHTSSWKKAASARIYLSFLFPVIPLFYLIGYFDKTFRGAHRLFGTSAPYV